ncbi:hypothetical protein [Spirosoma agri]|uniref:Uncharacterized protein n=1 Tax=Spirosoma agri TaxID=1987381 RepID=A0A6M0IJC6_9BACT|nr:hypothetical protein [Spirosoma agri]NEU68314.1 hypothetical protein [Spirosoma agri]
MRIQTDSTELYAMDRTLARVGRVFDARLMGKTLKTATQPVLGIARQEVPVGRRTFRSQLTRRLRSGKLKRDSTYDKGGATKRSLRILIVPGGPGEVARVLVGASKKRGYAGWRTHWITRPNIHRVGVNDFLARTESRGTPLIEAGIGQIAQAVVETELRR